MDRRLRWALAAALLCGACGPARADLFTQETLTGNWGGARAALAGDGVTLGADEIFDALGNPAGGRKQGAAFEGRFEAFATVDLGTALGWQGTILHANAYQIHGHGLSADDVGNLLTVGNIAATPATRLFDLWIQQSLFDDTVSVRLGQIAADDEFFISQYATLFLNSAFGWPSILGVNLPSGGPAYPLATPGVRVRVALSPDWIVTAGLFNGDAAPGGSGDPQARDASGTAFRLDGGAFLIGEAAYAASLAMGGDTLPGTYKLGLWYHDGSFADQRRDETGLSLADPLSDGMPALHRGDFGLYGIADQLLWRKSGMGDQGLGAFLRLSATPADRNLIAFHADGGFSFAGPFPARGNDTLGIAISYDEVGASRRALIGDLARTKGLALPPAGFESALELSYQAVLAPWWIVQPDMQLVLDPGAHLQSIAAPSAAVPSDALVLGLRTAVSF